MPPHRFKTRRLFSAADGGASSVGDEGYLRSAKLIPRIKDDPSDGKADNLFVDRYDTTIHRRIGLKNWALRFATIMVAVLWFACDSGPREKTQGPPPLKRENTVPTTSAQTRPMLPAIDREVPTELRTATFALG